MNIRSLKNLIFSVVGTALTVVVSHIAIDQYNDYKERKRLGLSWKQYRKLKKTFGWFNKKLRVAILFVALFFIKK